MISSVLDQILNQNLYELVYRLELGLRKLKAAFMDWSLMRRSLSKIFHLTSYVFSLLFFFVFVVVEFEDVLWQEFCDKMLKAV